MWVWIAWFVLGLVMLGLELHSQAFFAIFLALGAFAATVLAVLDMPLWLDTLVFAGVATGGALLVRPTLARMSERRLGPRLRLPGSSDAIIGEHAVTLDAVGDMNHPGHARLHGERWLAITSEPEGITAETRVTVVAVRGTTLVVKPLIGS
jgi:membrane protein implicated in regulation of membrane protease activity